MKKKKIPKKITFEEYGREFFQTFEIKGELSHDDHGLECIEGTFTFVMPDNKLIASTVQFSRVIKYFIRRKFAPFFKKHNYLCRVDIYHFNLSKGIAYFQIQIGHDADYNGNGKRMYEQQTRNRLRQYRSWHTL